MRPGTLSPTALPSSTAGAERPASSSQGAGRSTDQGDLIPRFLATREERRARHATAAAEWAALRPEWLKEREEMARREREEAEADEPDWFGLRRLTVIMSAFAAIFILVGLRAIYLLWSRGAL